MEELDALTEYDDPADVEDLADFVDCRLEEIRSTLHVGEVGVSEVMAVATESDQVYPVRVVNPNSMIQYNQGRDNEIDKGIKDFAETLGNQYSIDW